MCRLTPPLSFHSLPFLFPPQRPFSPPLSLPSAPDSNSRERPSLEMGYRKHRPHCAGPPGLPATGPSQLPPHSIPSGTRSCHFSAQTQGTASNSPLNTSWYLVAHTGYWDCMRLSFSIPGAHSDSGRKLFCYYCCYPQYSSTSISGHICTFSIIP